MDGILTDCFYDGLVEQVINEKVQKGVEQQTWTVFKSSGGGGQKQVNSPDYSPPNHT